MRALECGTLAFGAPFQFGQRLVDGVGAAVEVAVARVRRYLREHAVDEAVERCAAAIGGDDAPGERHRAFDLLQRDAHVGRGLPEGGTHP